MDNTPGFSGKKPDGCTTRGGNYWMPITPETWKVLHAGLQVKCSNHSTARLGGWCFPGRIWVRGYGESKKPVYEKTIGFVDKRYQGEKSRYHRVYRAATRWAMYMELIQNAEIECPLDDFGRMLIEKYDIETLTKKVRYTQWEETDLEDWEIDKYHWDKQVVYALVVKTRLQPQSQTTH